MNLRTVIISALLVFGFYSVNTQAASQDECAIWLCAPGGFPQGCGAAKSAMISRVRNFKPPLPPFAACAVNPPKGSGSHMSSSHGRAAYVPARRVCTRWGGGDAQRCMNYEWKDEYHIEGSVCRIYEGIGTPNNCTRTDRFVKVFIEGEPAGPTYYW